MEFIMTALFFVFAGACWWFCGFGIAIMFVEPGDAEEISEAHMREYYTLSVFGPILLLIIMLGKTLSVLMARMNHARVVRFLKSANKKRG